MMLAEVIIQYPLDSSGFFSMWSLANTKKVSGTGTETSCFFFFTVNLVCLENLDESTESGEDSMDEDDQARKLAF